MRHSAGLLWLSSVLAIMAIGSGCSSTRHFTRLPKPDEFKKPLQQLKDEYPDLTQYERADLLINHPYAGPLTAAWGEPHSYDFLGGATPLNAKYRRWEFEGKRVTAYIMRPVCYGFKPHVWMLTVEEMKKTP